MYQYVDAKTLSRFKRGVERVKQYPSKELEARSKKWLTRSKMRYIDMLKYAIQLQYVKQVSEFDEITNLLLLRVARVGNNQAEKELKGLKPSYLFEVDLALIHYLCGMLNGLGYAWKDYIATLPDTNAEQTFRNAVMELQRYGSIPEDSVQIDEGIKQQEKRLLNQNEKGRFSGAVENEVDRIYNQAKLRTYKAYNVPRIKFVAVADERTTKMCESMDGMIFNIEDWNRFRRYSKSADGYIDVECYGLVEGLNMPPINDGFHWCRSTMTYQLDLDFTDEWTEYHRKLRERKGG